jgi:hypothetical protein
MTSGDKSSQSHITTKECCGYRWKGDIIITHIPENEPTSSSRWRHGAWQHKEATILLPRRGRNNKGIQVHHIPISQDTFNMGQNKFAAQFMQLQKNVANYLQQTSSAEGYLVAEAVRTGRNQTIKLPPAGDLMASNAEDQKIIQASEVKTQLRWSWGRRAMAVAGEVTRHG